MYTRTTIDNISQLADFFLEVEYLDDNDQPIPINAVSFVAKKYKSAVEFWINLDETSEWVALDNNKITIDVPGVNMDFYGDGFYQLVVLTEAGQSEVLLAGEFRVERSLL